MSSSAGLRAVALLPERERVDEYVLVGGGLQNSLIALALLARRPETRLTLIEREARLGGNHTWCFHAGDAPAATRPWLDRLVERRWAGHEVRFPGYHRLLDEEYCAITSARLHAEVTSRLIQSPNARLLTARVSSTRAGAVILDDGRQIAGELVVDARGPERAAAKKAAAGYQKFLGLELEVARGSTPTLPILMDATVPQLDGFRFMYVLPLSDDRVLVEDTYYSTESALDTEQLRLRVHEYARASGLRVRAELREERGVLPIPRTFTLRPAAKSPVQAGYAGGFFHPTTGYSFPVALRFALHLARSPARGAFDLRYSQLVAEHRRQFRFGVWLNRLLFGAYAPDERYRVLERFYRLPAPTIRRFYALQTTWDDRRRILCGRPPPGFSLGRLIRGGQDS